MMNLNQDVRLINSENVIRYPYDQGNEEDGKKNESEEEKNNVKELSESDIKN
jgi:hypothetical protein